MQKLDKARRLVQSKQTAEGLALYGQLFKESRQCGAEYGRAAAFSGDFELAAQVWEKVRWTEPKNTNVMLWLAAEHGKIGLHAKASGLLSEISNIEPNNLEVRLRQAWLVSRTNSIEEARAAVDKCLALDAGNKMALQLAAHLDRRDDKLESAEKRLRELVAAGIKNPKVRYSCHSELAHVLDRTGRHEEAIALLEQAKEDARKTVDPQAGYPSFVRPSKEIQQIKSLSKNSLQTWAKTFAPDQRAAAPQLAFLTGSARSGTTLLERILDAHPGVAAFDESLAFSNIAPFIGCSPAPDMPVVQLNLWRQRYVKNLAADTGIPAGNKMLLDKNPSQTPWLPALLRLFPELRVLIGLRDPRDVIVSLYFQDQTYTNCLTFHQLAQHYSDVMDVWLTVREWEGLAWMETRYEDVVADLEKEGRRVTEFFGLDWHDDQARYHEKNRQKRIYSNNYSNVTKPVYTSSVKRWRIYEKYLTPILPMLEPYCKKFGHE